MNSRCVSGAHQRGIESRFRPHPEIPIKFFDFPDPEFSSSSSHRVFLFSTESLFKTVLIMQLPEILYKDIVGA